MRVSLRGKDDGQAATALVLLGLGVMLLLVLKYMTPLSEASDHLGQGQTAAEASALAGAQAIADDTVPALLGGITAPGQLAGVLSGLTSQLGRADADRLAAANDADLIDYHYDWFADKVTATIRPKATETGTIKPVTAVAQVGFTWNCHFEGLPTPSPSPTTTASPPTPPVSPTTPPPPPDQSVDLVCGSFTIHFTLVGSTGKLRVLPGQFDGLRPRLVG